MRNFYTYRFEEFTPVNAENTKPKKEKVIVWNHFYRIILVLVLFAYFSVLTSEFYNFIKTGLKLFILIVILQTFFKDVPVIDKANSIGSGVINFITKITKNVVENYKNKLLN